MRTFALRLKVHEPLLDDVWIESSKFLHSTSDIEENLRPHVLL